MNCDNKVAWNGDYVIIGAGPAGLQLGYFLKQAGLDYCILEANDIPGSFFKNFPRHRKLISINKPYTGYDDTEINLRWDWNSLLSDDDSLLFKNYSKDYFPSADVLLTYLADFANRNRLNIKYGVKAVNISKDDVFKVRDEQGNLYLGKRLIVATGLSKPYIPPIPGIELVEDYTVVSVDPEDFKNQKVLVIGKGNSGFETADNLVGTAAVIHVLSPENIKMAWKSHYVGNLRAVNNNLLDTYQLKSQNAILDASITNIRRDENGKLAVSIIYSHAQGQTSDLLYDRVITCTGFRFDNSIFDDSCKPNLVVKDRYPEQTCEWESKNVKDLYFAGNLMHVLDYKKTTSGFIHGFRYNVRALWRILEQKYHGQPWPSHGMAASIEGLLSATLQRLNRSSALWQQFGFLCDVIVVDGGEARYYEELPKAYIHHGDLGRSDHYYTITLEFGCVVDDPFNIERYHDPEWAKESAYLHPVIRRFCGPELVADTHLLEDLYSEWWDERYVSQLREFFQSQLHPQTSVKCQAGTMKCHGEPMVLTAAAAD
jgi:thioredoxin reductase